MKSCKNAANLKVNNMAPTYTYTRRSSGLSICVDLCLGGPKVKKLRPVPGVLQEKISPKTASLKL